MAVCWLFTANPSITFAFVQIEGGMKEFVLRFKIEIFSSK